MKKVKETPKVKDTISIILTPVSTDKKQSRNKDDKANS